MKIKSQSILFYDGDCGFCNHVVSIVLKHESNHTLLFSPLQGEFARAEFPHVVDTDDYLSSFKIKSEGRVYEKSQAFFFLVRYHLKWYWKPLLLFNVLPLNLLNHIYDIVARNRHRLMGNSCYVPTAEQRARIVRD